MYSTADPSDFEQYALEVNGEVQGLMQLRVKGFKGQTSGAPIVYMDYVAVAPWNRENQTDPPRYKAVGSALLAEAVAASLRSGFDGCIGLHSLDGAVDFYRKKGMTSFGCDQAYYGLQYFEFDAEGAKAFLGK